MKRLCLPLFIALVSLTLIALAWPSTLQAQSLTSGDVAGTLEDPSGAAIRGATVTLTSTETGMVQTDTSNATGAYRFPLLNPGSYKIAVKSPGFQAAEQAVTVNVGEVTTLNIKLQVATSSQIVEVTGAPGVIQTENANVSTGISSEMVADIPNPGNDLTYYVQTVPGATMNTQAGYGNSATYGISATSNLFTVDGMNENDPFLNLNNSGATNLMLGANDVRTATVVDNGYDGEYGSLAGANVNFVTKSGSNKFHGNAEYFWNGRVLNANDWFNNNTDTPRSFDNANQWAASLGGPIVKDKTFFFMDTEGLRLLIPTAEPVNIPSPQFEAATLANIPAAEVPFYNQIFGIYNNAPGAPRATNSLPNGGCDGSVTLAGGAPCALGFESNAHNLTTEWLLTARVDQNIGTNDRAFVHFRTDHGLQAALTDPLNPVLNAQSIQPQYEGQFQENHDIGANAVNQFILAGSWYNAVFGPPNPAQAAALAPYDLNFSSDQFTSPGSPIPGTNLYSTWPQGRHTTQYQVEDDYAWQKRNHSFKFGADFRRNDITDYTPGGFDATTPLATFNSEATFFNGNVDTLQQAFASRPTEPIALYGLGLYAQDEWAIRHNLKLTLSLRAEHNSDPVCQTNCFARLSNSFVDVSHDVSQPYNQAIVTGLHQAIPNFQALSWEPRVGFAWQPFGLSGTVVRGGVGIFADIFPGVVASSFDTNSPLKNTFVTTGLLAPGVAGDAQSVAVASNTAFVSGFNSGLNLGQIEATLPAGVSFSPPTMINAAHSTHYPTYQEWNFEVQQAIGSKMSLTVNYVGNHGSYLADANAGLNAFCNAACLGALGNAQNPPVTVTSFSGLPTAPLDPRFTTVTEIGSPGVSNYNGLSASFTRHMSRSFQLQAGFTWSHALDDVSNGGFLPFDFQTNTSILYPQNPYNLRQYNYGNADYDVRKQFNLSYVYNTPRMHGLWDWLGNWSLSGTLFARSGLPFTAIDAASSGVLGSYNYGPASATTADVGLDLFADSFVGPLSCSSSAAYSVSGTNTPCMTRSEFSSPVGPGGIATFGQQRRNQIYGPDYFDTDMTLMKNFRIPRWEGAELQVGAQAFNLFNHPNFDQPVADVSNSQFGSIVRTVATPTSIFGSFLNADASPRSLQLRVELNF